jgi:hypothetical protein
MRRVAAADFVDLFIGGDNRDPSAILEFEHIAVAKRHGLRKIDEDFLTPRQGQELAPKPPFVMCEGQAIERRSLCAAGGQVGFDAQHLVLRAAFWWDADRNSKKA